MDIYTLLRMSPSASRSDLQKKYSRIMDSYRLVKLFGEEPEVVELANLKMEKLRAAARICGLSEGSEAVMQKETEEDRIFAIKLALNSKNTNDELLNATGIMRKIGMLQESAEKYYLKAVASIRTDPTIQGCRNAIANLNKALTFDPGNPAYLEFLEAIRLETDRFADEQKMIHERAEEERREQERLSRDRIVAVDRAVNRSNNTLFLDNCISGQGCLFCCCCCLTIGCLCNSM